MTSPRRPDIVGLDWDERNEQHIEAHIVAYLIELKPSERDDGMDDDDTKTVVPRFVPSSTASGWAEEGWAAESEPLTASPRLEATISIRLDPESANLVRRAARLSGVTKSEFVRKATIREAASVVEQHGRPRLVIQRVERVSRTSTTGSTQPITTERPRTVTAGSFNEVR